MIIFSFPMVPNFNFDFSSEYRSAILSNSVTKPSSDVTNTSSTSPISSTVTSVTHAIEQTSSNDPEEDEFGDFEEAAPAVNTMSQITTNVSPFVTNSNFLPDNPTVQTFSSAEVSSIEKNSSRLVSYFCYNFKVTFY